MLYQLSYTPRPRVWISHGGGAGKRQASRPTGKPQAAAYSAAA